MEIEWLETLETRVREAVARLGELNEENRALRDRVRGLETEVATLSLPPAVPEEYGDVDEEIEALRARVRGLESDLAAAETERAEAAAAAKSWEIEREEVRRRVEALDRSGWRGWRSRVFGLYRPGRAAFEVAWGFNPRCACPGITPSPERAADL